MSAPNASPPEGKAKSLPASLGCGALMGAADAVPGVSGGTIALLLGIYEQFIAALSAVVRLPLNWKSPESRQAAAKALRFLIPLGIGLGAAYLVVLKLLVGKPDNPGWLLRAETAPYGYAVLFGVVLASIPEPWRHLRRWSPVLLLPLALGALAAFSFTVLPYRGGDTPTYQLLFGGAAAISVMLLPGVSGSLLLVVLGQYQAVSAAFLDRDFARIGVFLLGVALGVALFVPLLRRLLVRAHDLTMAALTGLMIGSLGAVWPFKDNFVMKTAPMRNVGFSEFQDVALPVAGTILLAAALVRILLRQSRRRSA